MKSDWLSAYIQNALRIDRAFSKTDVSNFIDNYYGPAFLRDSLKNEDIWSFSELSDSSSDLLLKLSAQGFEKNRELYFEKHLRALTTITDMYSGIRFPFYELVEKIFDIEPVWIPEEEFEASLGLLDQALPGIGNVRTRYQEWQESLRLSGSQVDGVVSMMKSMLAEARQRTEKILPLPDGEGVQINLIEGVTYGAANWYEGNFQSRIELNRDRAIYPPGLLYQMCHEGYPGHHTESCLKELHLYRNKGWLEQSLYFTFGPQLVVSEGIASLAPRIIFTPAEAAEWYRVNLGSVLMPKSLDVDLEKIFQAFSITTPDDLTSNVATLVEAGRKNKDILDYALEYTIYSKEQIEDLLPWLSSQMARLYSFTYSHGKRLIEPLLKSDQRDQVIQMLLTEQVLPSRLAAMASEECCLED